jgi:DNA-binding MltR family transcriptional regulator
MRSDKTPAEISALFLPHVDAGNALVVVGKIEDTLEKLLLTKGRPLSNALAKRIFRRGALSSLSDKIEIAYLFELIDETQFQDLLILKDVRNIFAHTSSFIRFGDLMILEKCKQLSTWHAASDARGCFYERSLDCIDILHAKIDALMFEQALTTEPAVPLDDE